MHASDRIRKVEAVVIAHKEYGEADRFVRIFTLQYGKLNTLAKGVRKMQSRKAAHLEPFTHAALVLAHGQTFWIITQAETVSAFPAIREDLDKTTDASYIMELVDKISTEGQAEPALFRLALESLKRINDNNDTYNIMRYFELRFLDIAGFRPELQHCVACKKEIQPEDQYFSPLQGGILCPQCGQMDNKAIAANQDTLRYLRHFQRSNYKSIENIQVPPKVRITLQRILGAYLASVLEWQLKTPAFQKQIRDETNRSA
ncbi:DNA repair protein RecO [Pelolinea submarina]|uniref:DNA repair protein RecO n=1 Tax=Pelolinea submarina TaxID=913107 RepID=A0A347ZPW6_9CHLR|nr:DNA repair protein RecO [Pelolinea submarina]REG04638.1 DNA replication and repair protein RecO [Pelolinea submarina]BBB47347.1 DNA repair protein RecO [Pelolinea submarina]